MKEIAVNRRGWTLDVLNAARWLVDNRRRGRPGRSIIAKTGDESLAEKSEGNQSLLTSAPTFTTVDAYTFTREMEKLHPDDRHVRDKIRQQLQVLRDMGLLVHVERGVCRLPKPNHLVRAKTSEKDANG